MAGIDSRIRGAIMNADVKLMTELQARKAELPMLCLIQSHAERRLADQVYGKDYNDARLALDSAKADFEAKTEALEALKERHRNELEAAEFALRESETTRNSAQSAFILANNVLTRAQQGHKHALERLGDAMTNGGSKK
jgi:hypothetical protein